MFPFSVLEISKVLTGRTQHGNFSPPINFNTFSFLSENLSLKKLYIEICSNTISLKFGNVPSGLQR